MCLHFANLSLVSTSKQKRLSMDSVFRRMQDFSVSCVGPCGGGERREVGKQSPFVMEDNLMKTFFIIEFVKSAHLEINGKV